MFFGKCAWAFPNFRSFAGGVERKGKNMKFSLYLNGFLGLSLGGAAILNLLKNSQLAPERIYTCGVSSIFVNDYAATDKDFEKKVIGRFEHLSKEFRMFTETFLEDSYLANLTETYRLARTAASRKFTGILGKKFELSKMNSFSRPKLDVLYSAVEIESGSEILFDSESWKSGLETTMAITPFFGPVKRNGRHLVSTTMVTGVPGFSALSEGPFKKIFVNSMPRIKDFSGNNAFGVMMAADYARTLELVNRYAEKFDFFVDFSEYQTEVFDFTNASWRKAKKIAHHLFSKEIEKLKDG